MNSELIARWLPARDLSRVLKTDLFDEFASDGLYPPLAARADAVVGIDVSPVIIAGARQRYPQLEAIEASVLRLPFGDAEFDAVVSNSTLDHLEDEAQARAALGEIRRVLRPGAPLLLTLDNPVNPLVAVRNVMPSAMARKLRNVSYDAGWTCGPRTLGRLLDATGFEVRELSAVLHAPRFLIVKWEGADQGKETRALRALLAVERLGRWPTRYLTGHFVAALAVRDSRPK